MNRTLARFAPVAAAALIVAAGTLIAGPLNPPAGPVGSTMKPLSDVEPRIAINATNTPGDADSVFKITQPGSYYLTGNVSVPASFYGVEVAADNVTLDMNGFAIVSASASSRNAVVSLGSQNSVVVRGGLVQGPFTNSGISLSGPATVEDMVTKTANISVSGSATVRRCRISANSNDAISITNGTGDASIVEDCQVQHTGSAGRGIFSNHTGVIIRGCSVVCSAASSTAIGIEAYAVVGGANAGQTITGCTVSGPFTTGISTGSGGTITDCLISNIGTLGIKVYTGNALVEHNRLISCPTGIDLSSSVSSTVVRNRLRACTTAIAGAAGDDVAPAGTAATSTSPNANIVN